MYLAAAVYNNRRAVVSGSLRANLPEIYTQIMLINRLLCNSVVDHRWLLLFH